MIETRPQGEVTLPLIQRQPDRNPYIQAYTSFLYLAGKSYPAFLWNVTWLSSKNRFNSWAHGALEQIWLGSKDLPKQKWLASRILKTLAYAAKTLREIRKIRSGIDQHREILATSFSGRELSVIKTFLYAHNFRGDGKFQDPFFGSLAKHLETKGNTVITFFDPIGCGDEAAKSILTNALPYQVFLRPSDIFKSLMWMTLSMFIRKPKSLRFKGVELSGHIHSQFRKDIFSPNGLFTLLMYFSTKRLAQNFKIRKYYQTFENNPWEKMCITALREVSPNTEISGYQHSVVPEASMNLFPALGEDIGLDRILTTGPETSRILKSRGDFSRQKVIETCGLRFEYLQNLKTSPRPNQKTVLVALEGVPEVSRLVNYVCRELGGNSTWKVILRTHPAHSLSGMGLDQNPATFENFEISTGSKSLKDDIERASVVLYWGSTVALEAIRLGRPVVHFRLNSLVSYDPAFKLDDLKWNVQPDEDLKVVLEQIQSLDDESFRTKWSKANDYVSQYFYPVVSENLDKFQ